MKEPDGRERPNELLITTSFLVLPPGGTDTSEPEVQSFLEDLVEQLRQKIAAAVMELPHVSPCGNYHFAELGSEETNAHRCQQCGLWGTDDNQPDTLDGLMPVYFANDRWLCNQHYEMGVMNGTIPKPDGWWQS